MSCGYQVDEEMDAHIREVSGGVDGWGHGYLTGGIVVASLIAWAWTIRMEFLCDHCGSWEGRMWPRRSCQCWNDE